MLIKKLTGYSLKMWLIGIILLIEEKENEFAELEKTEKIEEVLNVLAVISLLFMIFGFAILLWFTFGGAIC